MIGTGNSGWSVLTTSGTNNYLFAFNKAISTTDAVFFSCGLNSTNIAIVGNLLERIGSSAQGISELDSANLSNILLEGNTFVGQRYFHENVLSAASNKNFVDYICKNNIWNRGNHRVDLRTGVQDATMIGTWSTDYSVGCHHNFNCIKSGVSYAGDQDFWGIYSNTTALGTVSWGIDQIPGFVSANEQQTGNNTGNGNYMPTGSAVVLQNRISSGVAARLTDVNGNYVPNNGTATIGAVQRQNQAPLLTF